MVCIYHFLGKKKKKSGMDLWQWRCQNRRGKKNSLLFPHNPNKRKLIEEVSEDSG